MAIENLPGLAREAYGYDPVQAKQLLTEAGYPTGFSTTLLVAPAQADYLALVKGWWEAIGIEVELEVTEVGAQWAVLLGHTLEGTLAIGWGFGANVSPFYRNTEGEPHLYNGSDITDPLINQWYDALDSEFDDDARTKLITDIYVRAIEYMYEIILPTPNVYNYWQPWVGGYHGETTTGFYDALQMFQYVWIDEDMKASMGQ